MKRVVVLWVLLSSIAFCVGQTSSRNGYTLSPTGTYRLFVVFADVVDDPHSDTTINGWPAGSIPRYADSIVDFAATGSLSQITPFFREASFREFAIIGDYYPELVEVQYDKVRNRTKQEMVDSVLKELNLMMAVNDRTQGGLRLGNFDDWSPASYYQPKNHTSDQYIDCVVVVWRINSTYRPEGRTGGNSSVAFVQNDYPMAGSILGYNSYIHVYHDKVSEVLRHEVAHKLMGGNEFHNGGAGAGEGNFLSNMGGYSIVNSFNNNLFSSNGWERWRLGWKPATKTYYISARNAATGAEVETDLVYGQTLACNEFILGDYSTTGDAIRIKLPYLKTLNSQNREQYLWIENHQIRLGTQEYDSQAPAGIRINLQIGMDGLEMTSGARSNTLVPLSALGNYDMDYVLLQGEVPRKCSSPKHSAYTTSSQANPFTGYHLSMLPAIEIDGNDTIYNTEVATVRNFFYNGDSMQVKYPYKHNPYDVFPVGFNFHMASNPAPVPMLTYMTSCRPNCTQNDTRPQLNDNRMIYLNGLSVKVMERDYLGRIRVRIEWDDFEVDNNVRWCGPIVLTEQVLLQPYRTLLLDQGYTPTRPCNPIMIADKKTFADTTVFTCLSGSLFQLSEHSTVHVTNCSKLVVENGAMLEVMDGATLHLDKGGRLIVKSGGRLIVYGAGRVDVDSSAHICVENGAVLLLDDTLSSINIFNADCMSGANCMDLSQLTGIGDGVCHLLDNTICIQNTVLNHSKHYYGRTIKAGHHVCPELTHGDVTIPSGKRVVFQGTEGVTLGSGFKVKRGAEFEVRNH